MYLLKIDMLPGILIGVTLMVLLFCSVLVIFLTGQRRKLEIQMNEQTIHGQNPLKDKNLQLEQTVQEKTRELQRRETVLQETLSELKATREQLVKREKMASLGELMAGIVHEIQNPLNFINNFSEVTVEIFEDLNKEQAAGNEKSAKELEAEILDNLQKINFHGKRAASIIKGMLQQSRINSGKKEPTNINELTEECVQLTYQGMQDKSFQLKFIRDYEKDLPMIELVPQDIGRVIINLVSNAIYSVKEKKLQSGKEFEPVVTVSTLLKSNKVNIKIKDNGKGIDSKVVDKIFQPFFTTKPSGQGTGLGLSLSYEIIKAHNGEITVSSEEGSFAEFIIQLPV